MVSGAQPGQGLKRWIYYLRRAIDEKPRVQEANSGKRVNGKPIVARATMHGTVPQPSRRPGPGTQPDQGPAPSQTRDRHPARPGTGTQPDQDPAPSQTSQRVTECAATL
ncbi:unnamed protein product [Arctogadus glacialis]